MVGPDEPRRHFIPALLSPIKPTSIKTRDAPGVQNPLIKFRLRAPVRSLALAALLAACATASWAQSRGELLYVTHCVACHSAQMHWRDKKQVVDWPSLQAQVRLWQATGALGWDDSDVEQVARYLNDTYYRFLPPRNGTPTGLAPQSHGLLSVLEPARREAPGPGTLFSSRSERLQR